MQPSELIKTCFNEYRVKHPSSHQYNEHSLDRPDSSITSLDSACIISESVTKLAAKQVLSILGTAFIGGTKVELSARSISLRAKDNEPIVIVATESLKITSSRLLFENVNIIITKHTVFAINVAKGISGVHGFRILQAAHLRDRITPIKKYVLTTPRMAELVLSPFEFSTTSPEKFKSFVDQTFTSATSLLMIYSEKVFFKIGNTQQAALMRNFQHFVFPRSIKYLPCSDSELCKRMKNLYETILCMPIENKDIYNMLLERVDTLNLPLDDPRVQTLLGEIRLESNTQKAPDQTLVLEKFSALYQEVEDIVRIYKEMIVYYIAADMNIHKARFAKNFVRTCGACGRYESTLTQLKTCAVCLKIFYCSEHCQKTDWPSHRNTCTLRIEGVPK